MTNLSNQEGEPDYSIAPNLSASEFVNPSHFIPADANGSFTGTDGHHYNSEYLQHLQQAAARYVTLKRPLSSGYMCLCLCLCMIDR